MSDTGAEHELKNQKGAFSTLKTTADWLYRKGQYDKAIDRYKSALSLNPGDSTCLIGRSKCFILVGQFENALKDAESVLKEDKTCPLGLYQKAEALYYMKEFEFALVFYVRGQKLRPQCQNFRLGIQKSQEAIENAFGNPSSVKLENKGDLSLLRKDEEREQPITAIQHLANQKKQHVRKSPKNNKINRKLLGEFYNDKMFLENLLKEEEDMVNREMKDVIQSSLQCIDTFAEFWSQEIPICGQEKKHQVTQKKCSKSSLSAHQEPSLFVLKSLDDWDAEMRSGNAEGSLKKAEVAMKTVQGWSEEEVPRKKEFLGSLHACMGNALIVLGDMDRALEHHHKDLELAKQCKLSDAMSRALENVGRAYAQNGQFSEAIEFWEKKIPLVRRGMEETWLFHEIGWCYLKLGRAEKARDCAVASLAAADEVVHKRWQMFANFLVAQSELKLGNHESCVSHLETALTHATQRGDAAAMTVFQKALGGTKQLLPQ